MHYATRFNGIPVSVTLAAAPALADRPIDAPDRYEHSCIETPLGPKSLLLKLQLRRVDGSPFKVTACKVEAAVPGLDLHRVFVPVLHEAIGKRDLISLPWGVEERTFTSWSFPFVAALNRFDQNRFCMGFMDHVHAADTRHSCYDEDANMSLQRLFDPAPRETSVWEETLYLSCEDRPVFDEVRAFSRTYDEWHKVALPPAPPSVWEPIWCSWYGIKNDVDADYIRRMWILNGGAQEHLYTRLEGVEGEGLQARVYDRGLEKTAVLKLSVEDRAVILDLAVEIGGVLELQSNSECL